jgi:hypothetical protein
MKDKKLLASTITFAALPSASTISGSDIFPGTQSGSDVKYTFNQVSTFVGSQATFQNVYNNSGVNPSFQIGSGGFSIKDPSSNSLMSLTTSDNINFTSTIAAQGSVILANLVNSGSTLFNGKSIVNYYPVDVGVGNSNFVFTAQSNTPFGQNTPGNFSFGFSDESSTPSGFFKISVMNSGSTINSLYATGTGSGNNNRVGISNQLTVGIPYGSSSNTHAQLQLNTTTQGFLPPVLTSTQESTLISLLSSGDAGLFWYNTTIGVPTYWDGLDRQQLLAIDKIIQGTNMNIVNNGDGTVTFSSSGSSGTTQQVNGAFTVFQNGVSTTPLTSTFNPIAIDATKFTVVHQNGTSVTTATISGVTTPIIMNTSAGGTRYCNVTFDISISPSFADGQLYTFAIIIQRSGGGLLVITNFQTNFTQPTITTASGLKPISLSGLVDLGTNDYVYLAALCNTPVEAFVAYNFNAELTDTTVASLPSTDALIQGSDNLYLSQNGGATYENITGGITVGHLASFSTTGGQLEDSGTSAAEILSNQLSYVVVTGTTQQMAMNTVYFVKGGSTPTFTLPPTSSNAGRIEIIGTGTANWVIVPFSGGQSMEFNGLTTSISVQSGTANDNLRILYPGDGSGVFNLEFSNGMQITLT